MSSNSANSKPVNRPKTVSQAMPHTMPHTIGITGGIGSGKSHVCRRLIAMGYPVFFCDDEAKAIIRTDADVRRDLTALVGPAVYDAEGRLDKAVLAAYLCGGCEQAARVDAIVHPRVAERFRQWAEQQTAPLAFMECALLFESGFDRLVGRTAAVVADEEVRLQRVMQRDGVSAEKARAWMALQWPEAKKTDKADYLIHNNGDDSRLMADVQAMIDQVTKPQETPHPQP